MTKSHIGKYLIAVAILMYGSIVGLVLFFYLSGPLTLESRLINSITDHVQNKSIFTASKLIDKSEVSALNGDTSLYGVFQLRKSEARQLLDAKQMLICSSSERCEIEVPTVSDNDRCQRITEDRDVLMEICVNMKSSQVRWSYSIT